jgi:hypothetical protein
MAINNDDITLVTRFEDAHNFGIPFQGGSPVVKLSFAGQQVGADANASPVLGNTLKNEF